MAEISVGGAVGEGFALIRSHPLVVALWGLARIAPVLATYALLAPFYFSVFEAARAGAGAAAFQANPQLMQVQSLSYVIEILQLGVYAVVYCAVLRAVLHPERSQFAFLRVGAPEFFVFILLIGASFAIGFGLILAVIVAGIIVGILVVAHLVWIAVLVGVLAGLALIVALIYAALRFSLVGPMIVDDGQFHLGESWTLTRGRVGSLFMVGLVLGVTVVIAEIILLIVFVALGVGVLAAIAGGLQNLPTLFQQPPQSLLSRLAPILAVVALIWVPFTGGVSAIVSAPWARAYRDLKPPDLAATFA
jgi:hypothetical protein